MPHLFIPYLFSSQPCEHIFRTMRSMGTVNYTKINFNLNELFHLISRFEMVNTITSSNKTITFEKHYNLNYNKNVGENPKNAEINIELPSDEEILDAMINARSKAIEKASEFDIFLNVDDITNIELQFSRQNQAELMIDDMLELFNDTDDEPSEDINDEFFNLMPSTSKAQSRAKSQSKEESFIDVIDSDGTSTSIKKTTFIWMLTENKNKLSTDRLRRVCQNSPNKKFKLSFDGSNIVKCDKIKIGDWALFNFELNNPVNSHLIGNIVGFRYLDKSNRAKQMKVGFVLVNDNDIDNNKEDKNVEILAIWYTSNDNGVLSRYNLLGGGKITVFKRDYIASIRPPLSRDSVYVLDFDISEINK